MLFIICKNFKESAIQLEVPRLKAAIAAIFGSELNYLINEFNKYLSKRNVSLDVFISSS